MNDQPPPRSEVVEPVAALEASPPPTPPPSPSHRILRRVLQLGFLFFLLKGIAWLVVAWLAWKGLT